MLKKILLTLGIMAIAAGGGAYYFWQRATHIPPWLEGEQPSANPTNKAQSLQEKIQQQLAANPNSSEAVSVTLSEQELSQALNTEVKRQLSNQKVLPPLQTRINGERLEVGTVLDPQSLQTAELSPGQQRILERVLPLLPSQKQPFYIGIEGQPTLEGGQLSLTENSRIKVGELSFSVNDVSQRLNIPPEKVNQLLQINIEKLNIEDLQLQGDQVLLKVKTVF